MSKKQDKTMKPAADTKPTTPTAPQPAPETPTAPVLTPELIAALRAADSVDEGLKLLQPDLKPKARPDALYELNTSCQEPLPQKRGACLKVITVAVRLNRPFKVSDVAEALPDVKSAPYWTRKLAKTGHLVEVAR